MKETRTWSLTYAELQATKLRIEKLNQRAIKKGWTGLITVEAERVEKTHTSPNGLSITQEFWETSVTGEPPKYEGYTFLARVEWDQDSGPVVYGAPGAEPVNRDNLRANECDHCHVNRYRRYVYIVQDESGNQIQVGSTCLRDFLGWKIDPVWIATPDLDEWATEFGGYGHSEPSYSTETVLAAAWAIITRYGYVRASDWNGTPTKVSVADVLDPASNAARKLSAEITPLIPQAMEKAGEIRQWILSDEFSGHGDYVQNLKNIAGGEFVRYKNLGFLVSAPQAWARAQERDLIRRQENQETLNEWNGAVGDKLELVVTVKAVRFIDSAYGVTVLYTMLGSDNRTYKWFASRPILGEEASDQTRKIRGTVKKLDEYQGHKSTVLTRVKEV